VRARVGVGWGGGERWRRCRAGWERLRGGRLFFFFFFGDFGPSKRLLVFFSIHRILRTSLMFIYRATRHPPTPDNVCTRAVFWSFASRSWLVFVGPRERHFRCACEGGGGVGGGRMRRKPFELDLLDIALDQPNALMVASNDSSAGSSPLLERLRDSGALQTQEALGEGPPGRRTVRPLFDSEDMSLCSAPG